MTIETVSRHSVAGCARQTPRSVSPLGDIDAWLRGVWDQLRAALPILRTPAPVYVLAPVARRTPVVYRRGTLGSPRRCWTRRWSVLVLIRRGERPDATRASRRNQKWTRARAAVVYGGADAGRPGGRGGPAPERRCGGSDRHHGASIRARRGDTCPELPRGGGPGARWIPSGGGAVVAQRTSQSAACVSHTLARVVVAAYLSSARGSSSS